MHQSIDKRRNFDEDDAPTPQVNDVRDEMASRAPSQVFEASNEPPKFDLEKEIRDNLITPIGTRVLVAEDKFKYRSKILVPEKYRRVPTTGVVIAVGDIWAKDHPVQVGVRVIYGLYSGTPLLFANRPKYRVLNVEEVIAIANTQEDPEDVGT